MSILRPLLPTQVSQAKGKRAGKLLEVVVSLDLVRQLFTKVRAFHRVRETIYIKVSVVLANCLL